MSMSSARTRLWSLPSIHDTKIPGLISPSVQFVIRRRPISTTGPTCFPSAAPTTPSSPPPPQSSLTASYYRGGTSRAIMLRPSDLPPPTPTPSSAWGSIFLRLIGSPDPLYGRQLDGMGGGISSLSKICVVGPVVEEERRRIADVEYTFAALGVRDDEVDMSGNCGNMSAAVGPFAVDKGIFTPSRIEEGPGGEMMATVRIFNTNTDKVIHARFPLDSTGRAAATSGYGFRIDGVADEDSAPVELRFVDPAGAKTGKLFPTGKEVDEFEVEEEGGKALVIRGTCIDVGNPAVFVEAEALGVEGTMTPQQIDDDAVLLKRLDFIRRRAAVRMGMAAKDEDVPGSIPKIGFVSRPEAGKGGNVTIRALSVGQPHKAVPVTTALALATAANVPGTTVAGCVVKEGDGPEIVVNHASGTLTVAAQFDGEGHLNFATVYRTARRLMEGTIFYKG